MKRTLLLTVLLAGQVTAATCSELTSAWCDEASNVINNGQGLEGSADTGLNGSRLSVYGMDAALNTLSRSSTAYATSGVDFTSATTIEATNGQVLVNTETPENSTFRIKSAAGWTALTNTSYSSDINVQVTGETVYNIFGAMGSAKAGQLTLEIAAGASIGHASYDGKTAAIAGSHGGGQAEAFNVYVEGGTVSSDIVGGAILGSGHIDSVKIVVNSGSVQGCIYGGSKTDGRVDKAHIIINGGTITGGINAGGTDGSVTNAQMTIAGGVIAGDITKGNAKNADVIIQGSAAAITGSVEADSLTLYNVQKNMAASVKSVKDITAAGNTNTAIAVQNEMVLDSLHLGNATTLSVLNMTDMPNSSMDDEAAITVTELVVGNGATLNANLLFTQEAMLRMEGVLTMGSSISLTTGMTLDLADTMLNGLYNGESITLFAGVDALSVDNKSIAVGTVLDATDIFTGLDTEYTYYMSYDGCNVSLSIPEPTTATLSLLALAALAARRRRKIKA
ncbi:MAG: hypothetical protein Q4F38_07235 [Akkermansia sp.]|nr:hypothetical protein [Akkermansia sp.]